MRKIIVHAGYVPYDIVRTSQTFAPKGIPASFIMLTPTDSSSIANWPKADKELTVTKGTESISKTIDEAEIIGDKNGIVTKIEFGTRKHTYRPLGLPVLTTEKKLRQSTSETEKPTRQKSN